MLSKYNSNITAGEEILQHYREGKDYVILHAQMQSGKSLCYWFVAFEALRSELVDKVVIFSGNRESELRNQVNSNSNKRKMIDIYTSILCERGVPVDVSSLEDYLFPKIKVVWGTELLKVAKSVLVEDETEETDTFLGKKMLFIWEESHFGQTKKQHVDIFLGKMGIYVGNFAGEANSVSTKKNYILSVSATPFSEVCSMIKEENVDLYNRKRIVFMRPTETYRGVKWYYDNEKIRGFSILGDAEAEADVDAEADADADAEADEECCETYLEALGRLFQKFKKTKKWAIIRCCKDKLKKKIIKLIKEFNWNYTNYDLNSKKNGSGDIGNISELDERPLLGPTVVFIKGMCRMGTVVPKKHISFVMEISAEESHTDTVLQGLLGRMCGYNHEENNDIEIYIPNSIVKSGEIERYISGFCEIDVSSGCKDVIQEGIELPHCAMNIRKPKKSCKKIIIPIRVCGLVNAKEIVSFLRDAMTGGDCASKIENFNDSKDTIKIKELICDQSVSWKIMIRKIRTKSKTYESIPSKIKSMIEGKKNIHLGGCTGNDVRIVVWVIDDSYEGFVTGDFYVQFFIDEAELIVPDTTHFEVFYEKKFV